MLDLSRIEELLKEGRTDEAMAALDERLAAGPDDRAFYLRGNAYRKKGDWQGAINNYLEAIEINHRSPAANALRIANEILDFYNKDMYNQ